MAMVSRKWGWEINNKTTFWSHGIDDLWSYRHLVAGLVRRQFLLNYQQTVLGPFWVLFQPVITLFTYIFVFNKLVGISTGALPPVLFYFSGIILWNFFSDSLTNTSGTFRENAQLFSKVYFPRIIIPLSVISTQFLRFLIQLFLFIAFIVYFVLFRGLSLSLHGWLPAFPVSILLVGGMSLGMGLAFSVITAKYRDITNLLSLGIRLLMFLTPVIYPLEVVSEKVRWVVYLNPLTPAFELFRLSLLGEGSVTIWQLLYSLIFTMGIITVALMVFNKQGDKLVDVV